MELWEFIDRHTRKIAPLEKRMNLAYWEFALTGGEEAERAYTGLALEIEEIYRDREEYEYLETVRSRNRLDPLQGRIADVLYLRYKGSQIDRGLAERMIRLSTSIERSFAVHRPRLGGLEVTNNEIKQILSGGESDDRRKPAWEASKQVGAVVENDLLELVELRNEAARSLGYPDYFAMELSLSEYREDDLVALFEELDELTRDPFQEAKEEVDRALGERFGIGRDEVMPWHYSDPFFQEAPRIDEVDTDRYLGDADIVEIAGRFYDGIGLSAGDIVSASDLHERQGKNPHAFCIDMDRCGDTRVLANVKNNAYWLGTMLHELGHGVYNKYIDADLPWLIRRFAHFCTTEAVAIFFGDLAGEPRWLKDAVGIDDGEIEVIAPSLEAAGRRQALVFARWCQVMFHFERALYSEPSRDLDGLWWELVERYQSMRRPEGRRRPDWAAKIHIVTTPVYYHNYMIGHLIASQLRHHIEHNTCETSTGGLAYCGNTKIGRFMKDAVFASGARYPWDAHVEAVTGEPLNPRYFTMQYLEDTA